MSLKIRSSAPVFRCFDTGLARAFYVDWLGFTWDGEHRVQRGAPLYAFLRLGAFHLHLSEHHGDATPGATALVSVEGLRNWHASLAPNPNMNPSLDALPWGLQVTVTDPLANRLRFTDQADDGPV